MNKITQPWVNGIIRDTTIDSLVVPQDSLSMLINMNCDRVGAIQPRPGILSVTNISPASPIIGMSGFAKNSSSAYYTVIVYSAGTYSVNSSYSTTDLTFTPNASATRARFASMCDYIFIVDGYSAVKSWGGTGSVGTTNTGTLPSGINDIVTFRNRLWGMVSATDKLYYTNVVSTTNTLDGGSEFLQISPADSDNGTALWSTTRMLLYFKKDHIYRIFSINSVDPEPTFNVGTYSKESIVEHTDGIYFHHSTGFYRIVGESLERVSDPIRDIVKSITVPAYVDICGWKDDDHIYWSVGDVSYDGITITNAVLRLTISSRAWTIYSYPFQAYSQTIFQGGSSPNEFKLQLVSDAVSRTYSLDQSTGVDTGASTTPISYEAVSQWYYLDAPTVQKSFQKLAAIQENATGVNCYFQLDNDNNLPVIDETVNAANLNAPQTNSKWRPLGAVKTPIVHMFNCDAKHFYRIRFRIAGNTPGENFIFRGFEMLDVDGVKQ